MTTHIGHFRELLAGGGEVGKKLDFLLQEMNREANTLLSKTAAWRKGHAHYRTRLAMRPKSKKRENRFRTWNRQ